MSEVVAKLKCPGCGRSFSWNPQYAGKSLKCECGGVIKAPSAVPAARAAAPKPASPPKPARDPDGPPSLDDLDEAAAIAVYDLANMEQPTTARAVAPAPAVAIAAAPSGGGAAVATSPMLGYAGSVRRPPDQQKQQLEAQVTNYFLPLALIVAGVLALFYDAHLMGKMSPSLATPVMMIVFVIAKCAINLLLVFAATLAAVKIAGVGLGEIGPALVKIAAAALLPAAVGDIVAYYLTGYVSWGVCLLMYAGLLNFLFDMDMMEIFIVTGIIWVVQTWVAMLILGLIFTTGMGAATGAGALAMSSPINTDTEQKVALPPDDVDSHPKEFDKYAQKALDIDQAEDAREWLSPTHGSHLGGPSSTRKELLACVEQLYNAGAQRVYTSQYKTTDKGDICTELIVFLPPRSGDRQPLFKFQNNCVRSIHPQTDSAQEYIQVLLN